MKMPWDPNAQDITNIIKQISNPYLFAYFVGHYKEGHDPVMIGEKLILDTGLFAMQYGQWWQLDSTNCTWACFDEFGTCQFNLWHETMRTA
jgi:hypothetical protein